MSVPVASHTYESIGTWFLIRLLQHQAIEDQVAQGLDAIERLIHAFGLALLVRHLAEQAHQLPSDG